VLSGAEVWALRLDAWIVAGGWCAVVAWLILFETGGSLDSSSKNVAVGFRCRVLREKETRDKAGGPRLSGRRHPRIEGVGSARPSALQLATERWSRLFHRPDGRSSRNAHNKKSVWSSGRSCGHEYYSIAWAVYGLFAVAFGRFSPPMWATLLVAPRFAIGALAWWASKKARHAQFASGPSPGSSLPLLRFAAPSRAFRRLTAGWSGDPPNDDGNLAPSRLIGQIIAACQVGAAAFLWSRWGDVRILSSTCWAACAFVALRWRPENRSGQA